MVIQGLTREMLSLFGIVLSVFSSPLIWTFSFNLLQSLLLFISFALKDGYLFIVTNRNPKVANNDMILFLKFQCSRVSRN